MRSWSSRLCWLLVVLLPLQGVSALAREMFAPAHFHAGAAPAQALVSELRSAGALAMAFLADAGPSFRTADAHEEGHHHHGVGYHTHADADDAATMVRVPGADASGTAAGAVDAYWVILPGPAWSPAHAPGRAAAVPLGQALPPWRNTPAEKPPRAPMPA